MRKPFSTEEKQQMIESINSGATILKSAKTLAKAMNRPEGSVITKMYDLKRIMGLAPKRVKRVRRRTRRVVTTATAPVQQPAQVFTMNFQPSRTEVHKDHVRLYF